MCESHRRIRHQAPVENMNFTIHVKVIMSTTVMPTYGCNMVCPQVIPSNACDDARRYFWRSYPAPRRRIALRWLKF